jgi:glycosyltransferase involved in cell wall biosynthesis
VLSFIVPAHNEEFELPSTLAAIHAATKDRQYEIIVADDASTDATAEIAKNAGAKVVSIDRRQIAAARNAGARAARGDIFFFVDADTRISRRLVGDALAALDAGCSGGSARVRADGFVPLWGRISLKIFSTLYFARNLGAGAFLFTTRKNYETVGGLDERYFAGEEVFFSQALKKLGRFTVLSEPMVTSGRKLRMHSGWHVWKRLTRLLLGGRRGCRSRDRLDLWYDGKRETRSAFAPLRRDEST